MAGTASRPSAARRPRTRAATRESVLSATEDLDAVRIAFLVANLGSVSEVARVLGVAKSQPSRWANGVERPGRDAKARILALSYALESVLEVMTPEVAQVWLGSANDYLDGALPEQVLLEEGPEPVVAAARAEVRRAYS